jgi:glycine betaine/choline ABC-type transport system substrate-binding protein
VARVNALLKYVAALAALGAAAGCSKPAPKAITVGSAPSTEGILLAEIAAQHLEKQLGVPIVRKLDLGSTTIAYEALVLSTLDVYPEDTNAILVSVMKEPLDPNADNVLLRIQNEMPRLGRIQVLNPLGIHRRMCMAVRAADAADGKIATLSDAARSRLAWTIGVTPEFEQRTDGYVALMSTYNVPLKVPPKSLPAGSLYPALSQNQVSMIAGYDTDGPLNAPEFAVLKDDKGAFHEARTCFLVRQGALDGNPKLRAALDQLSGKFTNESVRQMDFEVDVLRHAVKDVAAGFLRQAGL